MATRTHWAYEKVPGDLCTYCGEPAEVRDHAYPASRVPELCPEGMRLLVPSCDECNGLLGDSMHETLSDRRAAAQRLLGGRYRKVLAQPDWSDDELAELVGDLRTHVIGMQAAKFKAIRRVTFKGEQ